jgi:hypothetical protein
VSDGTNVDLDSPHDDLGAYVAHQAYDLDPDCRDGKHTSCVGGPCECLHHHDVTKGHDAYPETRESARA